MDVGKPFWLPIRIPLLKLWFVHVLRLEPNMLPAHLDRIHTVPDTHPKHRANSQKGQTTLLPQIAPQRKDAKSELKAL
jgi:hypothetical protein